MNYLNFHYLISRDIFCLKSELKMVWDSDLRAGIYPIGQLGDESNYLKIKVVHNVSFSEEKIQWDRRRQRIN